MSTTTAAGAQGRIYLIAAHPHWRDSRVNRLLVRAAHGVPQVEINDLYASYPDYVIDIEAEQEKLARADLVVLLHPIQWYSMPPLQKLWLDEVLSYGWAYGTGGTALQGKDMWLVATTGGPEESYHPQSYNRYFFDAFLPPYEQTAALCGMRFLPPLVFHGARSAADSEITAHVKTFADRLGSYPNWPEIDEMGDCPTCVVPETDRPADDSESERHVFADTSLRATSTTETKAVA
ncbi:glutathione-regulated potassium-efflux system oxidoreductase KefF [Variovorax sp. PAMC 28711]|uniref:glutathione-regulated potassium-efflux system oxidoreductase KefF n=1 Tax=Variovorax sp. PAMC 28711 TaxID=1795631 RepID=UPI0009EA92F8|nr:NAD(P)H-dependent oxidoreductase [Variovorax sp. PAMC 28711]